MAGEAGRDANLLDRRLLRLQDPQRPWTVRFDATLAGAVPQADLIDAVSALVAARPELSARLTADGRRWTTHGELQLSPPAHPDEPIDLARAAIRLAHPAPERLVLDVNHGFTDGLGGVAILTDLLTMLAGDRATISRPEVDDAVLRPFLRRNPVGIARELGGLVRHVAFRPTPWPATGPSRITSIDVPLAQLRRAGPRDAGLTAKLVAAVHHGVAAHLNARRVSVSVPVDLRRHVGNPSGLGNAVVDASTRTRHSVRPEDAAPPVGAVARQLDRAATPSRLAARLGTYQLLSPPGPPAQQPRRRLVRWPETAVCSNLGRVVLPGCVRLAFSPPAHDLITIGVATVDETVTLTARARAPHDELDRLLARIAQAV